MKHLDHQIRLFLAIAESQSMSGAAMALGVTQSGLSRQLSTLEETIGQQLFERHGRGVALTEAGRKLQASAQVAYEVIDRTVLQLREEEGISEGSLRVGVIHTLSYYFMADVIAAFMSQRPNATVTCLARSSPEVVALVETGKAEIGFVYDVAVASGEVDIIPLFSDRMCLIVHESSPLAQAGQIDLTRHAIPLVAFPRHYALRRMLHGSAYDANVVAEVETVDAMLRLVSSIQGQCVLPDRLPTRLLHDYRLVRVPIAMPDLQRRVVAITRRGKARTPLVSFMLDLAHQAMS